MAGFPAAIGVLALIGYLSRSPRDGALPVAMAFLALAGVLLVLGRRSFLRFDDESITVRFFGLRSTTLRFNELAAATFGMAFPSISYAISLVNGRRRKVLVHANWWRDEAIAVAVVCRALLRCDVPMDRSTARIVGKVLRVKRPRARIVHRALLYKDRTW
ncbi:MAG TPA: hypothetical protein VH723_10045 [Candidatus Limnocylindrales bacterium]